MYVATLAVMSGITLQDHFSLSIASLILSQAHGGTKHKRALTGSCIVLQLSRVLKSTITLTYRKWGKIH